MTGAPGIDLDTVIRRRDDLAHVELDGELVIHSTDHGTTHKLEPLAAGLWHCFDGRTTLRDLATALAGEFDEDPEVVARDLIGYAQQLCDNGLAELVGAPDPSGRGEA
ncbi:PqqD family protein [Egibacter rhizosphaerae]|uniref:PqqD family protein n=1 Tax=Egibacter rhizosphaerae TaxID=1670831 RepID=A0A411YGD1_9ACTN|nr:PqqD family protein [Egibacter rhizosphaerae]QBI20263.1 PqqD family protein [Egibacter rhizosphaerae]